MTRRSATRSTSPRPSSIAACGPASRCPRRVRPAWRRSRRAFREQLERHDAVVSRQSGRRAQRHLRGRAAAPPNPSIRSASTSSIRARSRSASRGWSRWPRGWPKRASAPDEIVAQVEDARGRLRILALLETLEFLQRGGRHRSRRGAGWHAAQREADPEHPRRRSGAGGARAHDEQRVAAAGRAGRRDGSDREAGRDRRRRSRPTPPKWRVSSRRTTPS